MFYVLHKTEILYYGGRSVIIPMELDTFIKMVEQSYTSSYTPNPDNIKSLFVYSQKVAQESNNEVEWFEKVTQRALDWLNPEYTA